MKTFHSMDEFEKEYFPQLYAEKQYILTLIPKGQDHAISETLLQLKASFLPHRSVKLTHPFKSLIKDLLENHKIHTETRREEVMGYHLNRIYYWRVKQNENTD